MNRGAKLFFNCFTFVFLALTVGAIYVVYSVATDAMKPPLLAPDATEVVPTVAMLDTPTPKPSWTPSITPIPTDTFTPTQTLTFTPSATNTATATPSITYTPSSSATFTPSPTNTLPPPTFTPTKTLTPTPSDTPTFTPSPTGPSPTPTETLTAYPFIVQPGSLILRQNFSNTAGCNWEGIAGQVTTDRGVAVAGVQVRVTGTGMADLSTLSGTNTFYGPSGWEVKVADAVNNAHYQVSLWAKGVQVSPVVDIVFPNSCQQNLATVNFIQTRSF
jgi:hypothetical protein